MYSEYIEYFSSLNTAKKDGVRAPHKAILLISVIDLIEVGHISSPRVDLTERLEEKFFQNWKRYVGLSSPFDAKIATPFWHLKSEPFWDLIVDAPADMNFNQYSTKHLREYTHALIDEKLFNVLKSRSARSELKMVLISEYLQKTDVKVTHKKASEEDKYRDLRDGIRDSQMMDEILSEREKIVTPDPIDEEAKAHEAEIRKLKETAAKVDKFYRKFASSTPASPKLSESSSEFEYCLNLAKTYISDPEKADDKKAAYYIKKFYNTWFDNGVYEDMSFYSEELIQKYTQGYYELFKCAVASKKTHVINDQIGLFALAAFGVRIYEILTKEMTLVNHSLETLSDKMLSGTLSMADYPRFELLQQKQNEIMAIRDYLQELMALTKPYNGGKVYFNKI